MDAVGKNYFSKLISQIFHFWRGFVFLIFWVFYNFFFFLLFTSHTIHNPVLHFCPKCFSFFSLSSSLFSLICFVGRK